MCVWAQIFQICLLLVNIFLFPATPEMQQSMVQYCLPRAPFQRSHKLWQSVCSAVKLLVCRKKASFHHWKKKTWKRSVQVQNKLEGAPVPFASLMAMHQKCWHNARTFAQISVLCIYLVCTYMLNSGGMPRVECFPQKTHRGWRQPSGQRDLLKRLEDVYWRYAFLAVFVSRSVW